MGDYGEGWLEGLVGWPTSCRISRSARSRRQRPGLIRTATAKVNVTGSAIASAAAVAHRGEADRASLHVVSYNGTKGDGAFAVAIGYGAGMVVGRGDAGRLQHRGRGGVSISSTARGRVVKTRTAANGGLASNAKTIAVALAIAEDEGDVTRRRLRRPRRSRRPAAVHPGHGRGRRLRLGAPEARRTGTSRWRSRSTSTSPISDARWTAHPRRRPDRQQGRVPSSTPVGWRRRLHANTISCRTTG